MRLSQVPKHAITLRNGHQLVATARRLGLSTDQARAFAKGVQVVRSPLQLASRRLLARELLQRIDPPVRLRDGYAIFDSDDLPWANEVVSLCQRISEDEKRAYQPEPGGKGFLRSLLSERTLEEHPELLHFATSAEIAAVVSEYLGAVPTLSDVRLWWSVPSGSGTEPSASQRFHRDHEDFRQVKVFLNIGPVTPEGGPFTFLPAAASARVARALPSATGRYDDEQILARSDPSELITLTGPPGRGAMVDTCRCFHFGSRNESRERLVLMLHYVGYHSVVEPDRKVFTEDLRSVILERSRHPVVRALATSRPEGW